MSNLNTNQEERKSSMEVLINGLIKENPTFVLMLGMCPTLAVTPQQSMVLAWGLQRQLY